MNDHDEQIVHDTVLRTRWSGKLLALGDSMLLEGETIRVGVSLLDAAVVAN